MRETVVQGNENGTMQILIDAQMSKMSPEQRVALASINLEAKKRLAEIVAFDTAKEEEVYPSDDPLEEVRATEEQAELKVETPYTDALVEKIREEKWLPDPLEPKQGPGDVGKGPRHTVPVVTNSLRYTQSTLADEFARIFKEEIMALRNAGQKEYAHDDSSPFANFERGAKDMGIDRKQVLWIYAMKHKDGIAAHLKGQTSQREDVRGRVNDLIVYLLLLRGIFNEEAGNTGNFGLGDKA